jgi:hypothetical protein
LFLLMLLLLCGLCCGAATDRPHTPGLR